MIKTKVAFFCNAGFYPANQNNLKKNPDWLKKAVPPKKNTFALIM